MIKQCKVILNNAAVTVFDFDGAKVQIPSINADLDMINVQYENGKFTVIKDNSSIINETNKTDMPTESKPENTITETKKKRKKRQLKNNQIDV